MQLKIEIKTRLRGGARGTTPPLFGGGLAFAAVTAIDTSLSCVVLHALIQPSRAVFAFGGWVLGRGLYMGQQLLDLSLEWDDLD